MVFSPGACLRTPGAPCRRPSGSATISRRRSTSSGRWTWRPGDIYRGRDTTSARARRCGGATRRRSSRCGPRRPCRRSARGARGSRCRGARRAGRSGAGPPGGPRRTVFRGSARRPAAPRAPAPRKPPEIRPPPQESPARDACGTLQKKFFGPDSQSRRRPGRVQPIVSGRFSMVYEDRARGRRFLHRLCTRRAAVLRVR